MPCFRCPHWLWNNSRNIELSWTVLIPKWEKDFAAVLSSQSSVFLQHISFTKHECSVLKNRSNKFSSWEYRYKQRCKALKTHPSNFYTCLIQFRVAVIRREAGFTLDRSPVHHRATQRQTRQITTLTPRDNLESPINLTCSAGPSLHGALSKIGFWGSLFLPIILLLIIYTPTINSMRLWQRCLHYPIVSLTRLYTFNGVAQLIT